NQWETLGLPMFRQYFTALSEAMAHVDELLAGNGKMLTMRGLTPTLTVKDEELNRFIQSKSEQLAGFSFTFQPGMIVAGGKTEEIEISVKGRYVVQSKPENAVRFMIDSLYFNEFELPPSTTKALERQFDL